MAHAAGPSPEFRYAGFTFVFVERLRPERDAAGRIIELNPQALYDKARTVRLHKHGYGPFCKFRIKVPKGLAGVYALVVDGRVRYIGECQDLGRRFNMGYGLISPRNCYVGGQSTNCKVNRLVLDVSGTGKHVDLYFMATNRRKMIEKRLITWQPPAWNG